MIADKLEALRRILFRRRYAYRTIFNSPLGQEVLMDLAKFCRASESCFHEDPRLHAVLEGRREVFLRLQRHLNLTEKDLWVMYTGEPDVA